MPTSTSPESAAASNWPGSVRGTANLQTRLHMPIGLMVRCAVLLAVVLISPQGEVCFAQKDTVHLVTPWSEKGRALILGDVIDFTGRELIIKMPDGREARYPGERVALIETERGPKQEAAEAALAAGDYRQALVQFKAAVADEPRQWMRRKLLADVIWCYRNLGEFAPAGKTFLVLLQSDPTTLDLDAMPLDWESREPDPQLAAVAKTWLDNRQVPAAVLMGASYLMNTADRAVAVERLQALVRTGSPPLAGLAEAQLWRTQLGTAQLADVDRWPETIERLPARLRAGPYFVLGQALARMPDRAVAAALAFMHVPILYERDRALSAAALLRAAELLEQGGDRGEAERIYQELAEKHAASPAAKEARTKLEQLHSGPSS